MYEGLFFCLEFNLETEYSIECTYYTELKMAYTQNYSNPQSNVPSKTENVHNSLFVFQETQQNM